jgi:endonuclease-3
VTKSERAAYIQHRLAELYPDPPIPLDHTDAFTLLVAVLLSAQCTDVRVNQITPPSSPSAARRKSSQNARRADRGHRAPLRPRPTKGPCHPANSARSSSASTAANVPADLDELEKLPGVGHKTAQVVMAQSFGVPSFPVDTHIHRLAQRWQLTAWQKRHSRPKRTSNASSQSPPGTSSTSRSSLRPRTLLRPRLRWHRLRNLHHLLPRTETGAEDKEGLSTEHEDRRFCCPVSSLCVESTRKGYRPLPVVSALVSQPS